MTARRRPTTLFGAALLVLAALVPAAGAQAAPATPDASTAQAGRTAQAAPSDVVGAAGVVSLPPSRVLDTRSGAAVPALGTRSLQVVGRGGLPATGVSAVVLNVTVVNPAQGGYLTAYPDGTARPNASNLNFTAGKVVPNLVVVKVGANGKVALFNGSGGATHLLADVAGYVVGGPASDPGTLASLAPARLLDTRTSGGAVAPSGTRSLQVAGVGGVPATGASAVVLNVTAVSPTQGGYVTAYPSGTSRPTTSNLNFTAGQVVPNLVVVKLGADGKVALFNGSPGSTHLLADVAGYVVGGTADVPGAVTSLAPARLLDTRTSTAVPAGGTRALQVTGVGGVPSGGVGAVVLNVTAVTPSQGGYLTAYPSATPRPNASNLNFAAGQVVPNLVVVKVGTDGKVALFNGSAGSTHLLVDVAGWVSPGRGEGSVVPELVPGTGMFEGMACTAVDDCVAAHYSFDGSGSATVLEAGPTTRTNTTVPLPLDAAPGSWSHVMGAACTTDGTCVLPGAYGRTGDRWAPFAAVRTGTTWAAQRLADPAPDVWSAGDRVTCAPTGGCLVVVHLVEDEKVTATAHLLADGAWTSAPLVPPVGAGDDLQVTDVACAAVDSCVAVARYRTALDQERLVTWELVDGGWTVSAVDLPQSGSSSYADALVDCVAPGQCAIAVTYGHSDFASYAFWLGTSSGTATWSFTTTVAPGPVFTSDLDCESSGTCTLVGSSLASSHPDSQQTPLVRRLAGGTWSSETAAAPGAWISQVSCTDATSCTAIGQDDVSVVLHRGPGGWTRTEVPGGLYVNELDCPATGACTMVGTSGDPEAGTERGWLVR